MVGPATFGVAGAHEEPVRPGVKARRVAKSRKVSPDAEQRLLRRILGEVGVAEDPLCHRVEPVAHGNGEAREGLFVTALRQNHELGIHATSAKAPDRSRTLIPYGRRPARCDSIWTKGADARQIHIEIGARRRRTFDQP